MVQFYITNFVKFWLTQLQSFKYMYNIKLKESNLKNTNQSFISNTNVDNVNKNMCQGFISANIPLFI